MEGPKRKENSSEPWGQNLEAKKDYAQIVPASMTSQAAWNLMAGSVIGMNFHVLFMNFPLGSYPSEQCLELFFSGPKWCKTPSKGWYLERWLGVKFPKPSLPGPKRGRNGKADDKSSRGETPISCTGIPQKQLILAWQVRAWSFGLRMICPRCSYNLDSFWWRPEITEIAWNSYVDLCWVWCASQDAEEDALLVKQHDDKGRDIDALPYTDDDPVEHTEWIAVSKKHCFRGSSGPRSVSGPWKMSVSQVIQHHAKKVDDGFARWIKFYIITYM